MYLTIIPQNAHNLGFLRSLVNDMVHEDYRQRPTIDEVMERFVEIRGKVSSFTLRSRVIWGNEDRWGWATRSCIHSVSVIKDSLLRSLRP